MTTTETTTTGTSGPEKEIDPDSIPEAHDPETARMVLSILSGIQPTGNFSHTIHMYSVAMNEFNQELKQEKDKERKRKIAVKMHRIQTAMDVLINNIYQTNDLHLQHHYEKEKSKALAYGIGAGSMGTSALIMILQKLLRWNANRKKHGTYKKRRTKRRR